MHNKLFSIKFTPHVQVISKLLNTLAMKNFILTWGIKLVKDVGLQLKGFTLISIVHFNTVYLEEFINNNLYVWICVFGLLWPWNDANKKLTLPIHVVGQKILMGIIKWDTYYS